MAPPVAVGTILGAMRFCRLHHADTSPGGGTAAGTRSRARAEIGSGTESDAESADEPDGTRNHDGGWRIPIRIAVVYVVVTVTYLFVSDTVVGAIYRDSPDKLLQINIIKGVMFMVVTGALLAVLTRHYLNEQRRAQMAVIASNRRYHLIADATNDAIYEWDLQTDRVWWNPPSQQRYGHVPEDGVATFKTWLDQVHPDDRQRVEAELRGAIDSGQKEWCSEYKYRRTDATYATVLDRGSFLLDASGKANRMIGGMSDVTELRQSQEALQARIELNRLLYRELDHRVRNNLASLLSLLEIGRGTSTELTDFIASIGGKVRAMAKVHDQLSSHRWQPIEFGAIIRNILTEGEVGRMTSDGPSVGVVADQVTAVSMIFHELLTDALARAAANERSPEIDVRWTATEWPDGTDVSLTWLDRCGPARKSTEIASASIPLISGLVSSDLRGSAAMALTESGAQHTLRLRLEKPSLTIAGRPGVISSHSAAPPSLASQTSASENWA